MDELAVEPDEPAVLHVLEQTREALSLFKTSGRGRILLDYREQLGPRAAAPVLGEHLPDQLIE